MTAQLRTIPPLLSVMRDLPKLKTIAAQQLLWSHTYCNFEALILTRFYNAFIMKNACIFLAISALIRHGKSSDLVF